jgi:hypothetical protein
VKHLLPRTQQRQLSLQRSNSFEIDDNDDDDLNDFLDIHVAYRRPSLIPCDDKCHHTGEDELSDYITVRLALARLKAIHQYREIQTEEKG